MTFLQRWQVMLLTAGWLLAAAVIWWAGAWSERQHRYDDCTYVTTFGPQPLWVCPVGPVGPAEPEEEPTV